MTLHKKLKRIRFKWTIYRFVTAIEQNDSVKIDAINDWIWNRVEFLKQEFTCKTFCLASTTRATVRRHNEKDDLCCVSWVVSLRIHTRAQIIYTNYPLHCTFTCELVRSSFELKIDSSTRFYIQLHLILLRKHRKMG